MRSEPPIIDYLRDKGCLSTRQAVLCVVAWLHDAGRPVVWPADVTAHYPRRQMPGLPKLRAPADVMRALAASDLLERFEGLAPDGAASPPLADVGLPPPLGLARRAPRAAPRDRRGYRLTVLGRRAVTALPDRERHAAVLKTVTGRVWLPRTGDWTPWSAPARSSPDAEL